MNFSVIKANKKLWNDHVEKKTNKVYEKSKAKRK